MPNAAAALSERSGTVSQVVLDNGLQVVWEENHRQPLVAIEARIKGGLRAEGPFVGTGITHFIEHMLFKGTPSRPPGTLDQEVRRYGGTINAFTSFDTTGVTLFVESRHLKPALELLADILQHAIFDPQEFERERAVIRSEIQMNEDDPDRRIQQLFWNRHFLEHPYRHPILGYEPLLQTLTAEELTGFYRRQYQPQHMVLSCVGDLDGSALPGLVKEVFGGWARGRIDLQQAVVPLEPPTASSKDTSVELPVQRAYVLLGFTSTRLSDPDLYPLDVLANVIGQGRSARLYELLVRERQLVDQVASWNYTPADPGIFAVQFRTDPERVEPATDAVFEVLERIKREGPSPEELQKAKRQVIANYQFSRQTMESRAADLADSLLTTGDPLFSQRYVSRIEDVTAGQVREAAARYCDRARMTRAIIRPAGSQAATAPQAPPSEAIALSKTVLDNGATLIVGEDHRLPIAAIIIAFRGGVRVEQEETQGLSNLVARLLTKGTTQHDASAIARNIEGLGATLDPFSGRDGFGLSVRLLSEDLAAGVSLAHELVTASTFPEQELEIQRQLVLNELKAQDDEIFEVGNRLFRRTLFQQHPYRFHPLGAQETVQRLARADCQTFAAKWLVPSNMVMAVFGDVTSQAVTRLIGETFGRMPKQAAAWPERLPEEPIQGIRRASLDLPKAQALVLMGFRGSTQMAPDRHALDVLTAVLSGMSGRLFQAVREEHGLSYTLGAVHVPGWDPGYLMIYAATRPEERTRVLEVLQEELQRAVDQGVSEEEVRQAQRYLIGQHRMELQDMVGLARRSALEELYTIGYDAWQTYEADINAVTLEQVQEAARHYMTLPRRAEIVISPNGHDDALVH